MSTEDKLRDYLKKVTLELRKTQARLDQLESESHAALAPIAIVGMSCRAPFGVRSPEDFWCLLSEGVDAIGEFPTDRGWDLGSLYDPDPEVRGKSYAREGGFLSAAADFDAGFFGISPREALATDPQQRLLLETSWEALERAGLAPAALSGSQIGVFVGVAPNGYGSLAARAELEGYAVTGSAVSVASGRIAYTLGLQGPAVTVDTACSASLVALHLACQSLRQGECELALAGGASVMATPDAFIEFSRQRALAPDGRCKAFAASADGTGWGEAVGMLVLERVADAQQNGHPILALVRGSAINQDGKSQGLTAPNGPAQEQVIRKALQSAQLTAADVDAVEAHGTGTSLGDPIEAEALLATYGKSHTPDQPLWLGSVKSNLGHTAAAAGAIGVIKVVLSLLHGQLPKTLHAEQPTPHVDWSRGSVKLLHDHVTWPDFGRPRRAAVSSFGISGTNAHLILEQAPVTTPSAAVVRSTTPRALPFLVSARSEPALRAQLSALHAHVLARPELGLLDLAHSLATTRSPLEARAVVVAAQREELLETLLDLAEGATSAAAASGMADVSGKLVFVFPGQGGQWASMARELLETSEVFASEIEACARALAPFIDWSLREVLTASDDSMLERIDVVQPVLFSVMVSLAALWRANGIEPDAVVGHSQGEIAAAYVAGVLSLDDAARVVAVRSRLLRRLIGQGGMALVEQSSAELEPRLNAHQGRLSIAAVNSPSSTVVTGEAAALDALLSELAASSILARRVRSTVPGHCALTEQIKDELLAALAGLCPRAAQIPFFSTVSADLVDGAGMDAAYWYDNCRGTVRFFEATQGLLASGHRRFVEISAHPVLTQAVQTTAEAQRLQVAVVPTLRRGQAGLARFTVALGELYVRGVPVDWRARTAGGARVALPTYAFQRERYWPEPAGFAHASDFASAGLSAAQHPLLGACAMLADGEGALFTGRLSLSDHPWLAGHALFGATILPGTAFVELALTAAQRLGFASVEELTLEAPLILPERGALQLQLFVGAEDDQGTRPLTVHARSEDSEDEAAWTRHASASLRAAPSGSVPQALRDWPPPGAVAVEVTNLYDGAEAAGLAYRGAFRGLRAAYRRGSELFAEIELPEADADPRGYGVHPALLDAALHALALRDSVGPIAMPFAFEGVRLHATSAAALRVKLVTLAPDRLQLWAADAAGEPVVEIAQLRTRPAAAARLGAADVRARYRLEWVEIAPAEAAPRDFVLVGRDPGFALGEVGAAYADMSTLTVALDAGQTPPTCVVLPCLDSVRDVVEAAHAETRRVLAELQLFLADERLARARLVVMTRGAVAAESGERPADLARAPLWGLLRGAQSERPDAHLLLLDLDVTAPEPAQLMAALTSDEPQLALREGRLRAPRLLRAGAELAAPSTGSWSLQIQKKGTLDGLALVPQPKAPLAAHEVRVAVHAAGVNFRDVLSVLGMYPGEPGPIGSEGAGVVLEVGSDVRDLSPGQRVMGLLPRAFGPSSVTDRRTLVPVPEVLTLVEAAALPVVFMTAYYGLVDLGRLLLGQRVLIHAAAGGVGMAAIQLARALGAEVFATASPSKWPALRALGLDDDQIASSRNLDFEAQFRHALRGGAIDVVLNSLTGDFIDASLRLLAPGGRFIEMGKTDVRDAARVAAAHGGVSYRAFELNEAGPERMQSMLRELAELFASRVLTPLPLRNWDVRRAPDAFRYMAQARHVGKIVLSVPQPLPVHGSVLITGGTGTLGARVAEHLVKQHGVRQLVLCSRSGRADALLARLTQLGATVRMAACDVSQRGQLEALLESIPAEHPLCAVIHAAGTLDDGVLSAQSGERIDRVMGPKLDAAFHLHELTLRHDLHAFVMFSSVAGVLGGSGQSNYAAANTFLDALAHHRRALGLAASSQAWGFWAERSTLTAKLQKTDLERMARGGIKPLSTSEALALFDAAMSGADAHGVLARFDLRRLSDSGQRLPALLSLLAKPALRRATDGKLAGSLSARLMAAAPADRSRLLLAAIAGEVSTVMGVPASKLDPSRPLRELGLDSLMAVELRNRLAALSELRLPATLLFDHPTPHALAAYLESKLAGAEPVRAHSAPVALAAVAGEPIAIVAMSCRYPDGIASPEALWELLTDERDAIGDFPAERGWDAELLYDPDPDARGKTTVCKGAFLHDAGAFDAEFFGISPREALGIDPQQRLLLETAWEVLERAAIDPRSLAGSSTGVFVGVWPSNYAMLDLPAELEGHVAIGGASSVASGRIAYSLGLQGPAVTVDTACSSSLVSLHLACQALRQGECDLALAGGATIMATPSTFVEFSRQRGLAPDGRCKPFSDTADGTSWGEGVALLALERLGDARRNGHPVLALVRGSAINQDGKSQGLTAPNGPAQEQVIQRALQAAQLTAADVDAVEAHGTGTVLGDPIEAQALLATYGSARPEGQPLWLGSLKGNLGHTQAAAGVGGVMKLVLALEHELLPRSLHAEQPTRHVDWSAGSIELLKQALPWPRQGRARRAGVSAFGVSGTNAHVILEEAPAVEPATETALPAARGPLPFVISARSEVALRGQAERLSQHLTQRPELSLRDLAYSLVHTRSSFETRAVVVASEREALIGSLAALAAGERDVSAALGRAKARGKLVFVFPGQGAQWLGMALPLLRDAEPFAEQLHACAQALAPWTEFSLLDVLESGDESLLERVDVIQPVLFAMMVSLAALWRAYGVEPDAVIGHSQGEIAAACVASALTLEDAAKVVALRARALTKLSGQGGMAAVELPAAELGALLAAHGDRLAIAAVNGPAASVVSGDARAIDALLAQLTDMHVMARRIRVDYASHCAQLESIKDELLRALAGIEPRAVSIPFYSTLHARWLDGEELDPTYWYDNGRNTVRFSDAVQGLIGSGHAHFVEVSPHGVLTQAITSTADALHESVSVVGSLRRDHGGIERFLLSLGELHAGGASIDWQRVLGNGKAQTLPLPTYAFVREHYWPEASGARIADVASAGLSTADHPLLGASVVRADGEGALFTARLSLASHKWLAGHVVFGTAIMPGTGFVELALAVAQRVGLGAIEELTLEAPLVLPERGALQLQLWVAASEDGAPRALTIHSRREDADPEQPWTRHATGSLCAALAAESGSGSFSWPPAGAEPLALDDLYEVFGGAGLQYSGAFRGLRAAYRGRDGASLFAEVELPEPAAREAGSYGLHPALLDAALHAIGLSGSGAEVALPFAWQGVSLEASGTRGLRVELALRGPEQYALRLATLSGEPIGSIAALRTRPASAAQLQAAQDTGAALYRVDWQPVSGGESDRSWALLGECDGLPEPSARYADLPELIAALDAGAAPPEVVVAPCTRGAELHAASHALLALLQGWLGEARLSASRLLVVTRGAIAAASALEDLVHAPLWGLVRAAQAEHPDRGFGSLDLPAGDAGEAFLRALASEEPQLALREDGLRAPRLVRVTRSQDAAPPDLAHGTILITGGTGTLGALLARHLVTHHGVQHLLLCSRTGRAPELAAELAELGAAVTIAACDVGDRAQLAALIASIPQDRPLRAVFHTAGVLDDGVLTAQTSARIDAVYAPKLDAALHLHELTQSSPLAAFVTFSSIAGVLGSAGQANYAAANSGLDALAQLRAARGLPATSVAWGHWEERSALTGKLSDLDLRRIARAGIAPMASSQALALLDQALAGREPLVVAVRFEGRLFATPADQLPPQLRALGRRRLLRAAERGSSLRARLAQLPPGERERALYDAVAAAVSSVLAVPVQRLDPERPLSELGLDSLLAVELRNQLSALSELRLPSTLLFDHPTPKALCRVLAGKLLGSEVAPAPLARPLAAAEEPIAIVAMSCRYPAGADTPEALWEMLESGSDAVSDFPSERGWDAGALYDPDPDARGKSAVAKGAFLRDAAAFDAAFFGITPREALGVDPQQRLLLETAWEGLERAGIDPQSLGGSATGVFVGLLSNDYVMLPKPAELEGYAGIAGANSVASGRIAYSLGLQGPAVTIDTACSSSLVALHFACQSLRRGECDLALAGGATVMATPTMFVEFSKQRGLAPDGRCKSFADEADGTGWGEGVGLLVLERLADARRNGHPVLALVRGSAVNQDGRSQGLAAPNGPAQEQVIRQALASAQLEPSDVDAVEAHGTGTTLGDPIEAQALLATYGAARAPSEPLLLGSLKTNLGHTQAAAGVAGVMKMVLAFERELLPKSLHAETPSRHVDWSTGTVQLLREPTPWKSNGKPRRAGVSSFGISGTNAHVILEEPPSAAAPEPAVRLHGALPFVISGKSEAALAAQAQRLRAHLLAHPELSLLDVAHSLATSRSAFEVRAALVTGERAGLLDELGRVAEGSPLMAACGRVRSSSALALLFAGQGSQRPELGVGLYRQFAAFSQALDAIAASFAPLLTRPLLPLMFAPAGSEDAALLNRTELTQPALFAFELAEYRLLESWGIRPRYLLGHSVGEIVAAHVAGVMSLDDACRMVAARAGLMQALPEGGAMYAIEASELELRDWLDPQAGVELAAVNGARSVVVSGDAAAAHELATLFEAQGRRTRKLSVSHAFHSARMDPMLEAFELVVRALDLRPAQLPIISNVTGELADPELFADPLYWVRHVRAAVRFYPGVQALRAVGAGAYLEIGPQPVLATLAAEALHEEPDTEPASIWACGARDAGADEPEALLRALTALHVSGGGVDWPAFFAELGGRRVALPTYPFQHERFWLPPLAASGDASAIGLSTVTHPLLGASVVLARGQGVLFTGRIVQALQPWLAEHSLNDAVLVPSSVLLELALSAGAQLGFSALDEMVFEAPLLVPEQAGAQLQITVEERALWIHGRAEQLGPNAPWTLHARATLAHAGPLAAVPALRAWPPPGAASVDVHDAYERLVDAGVTYGAAWRALRAIYRRGDEWFAEVQLPEAARVEASRYTLHPALVEGARQLAWLREPKLELVSELAGMQLAATDASELRLWLRPGSEPGSVALSLADGAGEPVSEVARIVTRAPRTGELGSTRAEADGLYCVAWRPPQLSAAEPVPLALIGELDGLAVEARYPDFAALREVLDAGAEPPARVVFACGTGDARGAAGSTLELLQAWLGDDRLSSTRLSVVTREALATGDGDAVPGLAHAALWGLGRTAQTEYPDRSLQLIDLDSLPASLAALPAALASSEAQLALRAGVALVPRLAKPEPASAPVPSFAQGTVLITGGSGALAALVARHLVAQHGARRLLLCSRSGNAGALPAELAEQGADVRVAACDVADRGALAALLAQIPAEHPLCAVIHTAGVTEDGVLLAQDLARLSRVFAPKVDGAWYLHELTQELPLQAFVLFSSLAGLIGGAGQANYAAANAFLDALASHRRAQGLPATSLAWGFWAERSKLSAHVAEADRARLSRGGVEVLSNEQGLSLLDAALARPEAQLVTARFDLATLRELDVLPPILSGLVRGRLRRVSAAAALEARLSALPPVEQEAQLLSLVRGAVAMITRAPVADVKPHQPVQELGLDSLMALELRRYLALQTGLRLRSSLLFDFPTPAKLARRLHSELAPRLPHAATPLLAELDRLERAIDALDAKGRSREELASRLQALAKRWAQGPEPPDPTSSIEQRLYQANDEELYRLIDKSLSQ